MNRNRIVKIAEQFIVISGLQIIFLTYFKTSVVPSFFLVWLLILAWEDNSETALLMAFLTGILYDTVSRSLIGSTSIGLLIVVYINCFLRLRSLPAMFATAFLSSVLLFAILLFDPLKGFLWGFSSMVRHSFIFAFYNGTIMFFTGMIMRRLRWKPKKEFLSI